MPTKLEQLKAILADIQDLRYIGFILEWDQETYMPPEGARERGEQAATIQRLLQEKATSDEFGRLLEDLEAGAGSLDPDSDDARLLKLVRQEYNKRSKVPASYYSELHATKSLAYSAWFQARTEDNFSLFQPYLEKMVDLRRQYSDYLAPYDHPYDPLLDDFAPGVKTKEVQAIFDQIRPKQVELIKQITSRPQVDDSALHQPYDGQKQWDFGVEVISRFGYDWQRGRQDKTAHPFTTTFGMNDVRITTRILPDYVGSALFSTMHECGHALYEQGFDPALARTPLADGRSLVLHESQSRLWENLVGRSRPFWQYFYPRLQEYFPSQLGNVPLETFYKGINKVEPSLIRVEADEATYNLHVMLRLEIEIGLISRQLEAKDLPEVWNSRMKEYLGLVPPNNAKGVLQDVHWSHGYIGYFATYALGNLVSLQLWERLLQDIPNLNEQIREAEFDDLLSWLREKLHRHGAKFDTQEMVQRITGKSIDPQPYLRYLNDKFKDIYGY